MVNVTALPTKLSLCLVTSGVGGFDSLELPPELFRHEITRFQPIRKPLTITAGGFFLPYVPHLSPKGTGFVPPLHRQHIGHGVGQFILHFGYHVGVQVEGATHLGPLPFFGNRQIRRILFPTLLSPRNNASTLHLNYPQCNAPSREPCRLQQLHSGCLN